MAGGGAQREDQEDDVQEAEMQEEDDEEDEDMDQEVDTGKSSSSSSSTVVKPKILTFGQKPGQSIAKRFPGSRATVGGKSPRNPESSEKLRQKRGEQFLVCFVVLFLVLTRFVNVSQLQEPNPRRPPKRRISR
jgi:hypothetical protein